MSYEEFLSEPFYSQITNVIYKFKNKINNKIYIGQTTNSVRTRVMEHMTSSRPWTKARKGYFQRAPHKYGFENFEFTILEQCQNSEDLDIREVYWIGYYKSDDKVYGYNMTPGGGGNKNKEFLQENIKRLTAVNTGSKKSQKTKELISKKAKERMKDPKYKNQLVDRLPQIWEKSRKKVVKLSLDYNIEEIYDSSIEAQIAIYGHKTGALSRNLYYKDNKIKGFRKGEYIYMFYDNYINLYKS